MGWHSGPRLKVGSQRADFMMASASFTRDALADLLAEMGVGAHAKRTGDAAPDVTLRGAGGSTVRLLDYWRRGPLILVFFRGGWCSYCALTLRDWQRCHPVLLQLGATLLAISPQSPEKSQATPAENGLDFPLLCDTELLAASAFGIAFTVPPELVEYFAEIGTDIPVLNGNGLWALPVPATYVIDTRGVIRYADVEPDYRKRADPASVLSALDRWLKGGLSPVSPDQASRP